MSASFQWLFPTLEFRANGEVVSRRRLTRAGSRNPNYGKILSWRRHTKWPGFEMLEARDRFGRRTTIYRHKLHPDTVIAVDGRTRMKGVLK